jgi:hypothetical protein
MNNAQQLNLPGLVEFRKENALGIVTKKQFI